MIIKNLYSYLISVFINEEPTKLMYLSKRFEFIYKEYLLQNSNKLFLSDRLKEMLLIDINDILFKSNNENFFQFLSKNKEILTILDLSVDHIKVMLNTYSTELKVSKNHVQTVKFKVFSKISRVLPTSDKFEEFMSSFNKGSLINKENTSQKESDFCVTPKYQIYIGELLKY